MSNDLSPNIIHISPLQKPATGNLSIPGSKSIGNRALLLAAVAQGESELKGILDSDDTRAALSALSSLGVHYRRERNDITVFGNGLAFPNTRANIDIHSSGTVGRFLPGLLAACDEGEWRLCSTEQLAARPIKPLLESLAKWGAELSPEAPLRSFPLTVRATGLSGGVTDVSAAASSQFASGLLMAAPFCRKPAEVIIHDLDPEEAYINMTLDLLRQFGINANVSSRAATLAVSFDSPQTCRAANLIIEADANTANYFLSLALLTGGSVTIDNLRPSSGQPGLKFLDVVERLGGTVLRHDSSVTVSGKVSEKSLPLRGGFTLDMRAMSEMALTLGVLAVFADAPIAMTNLSHIRGHETDRLSAMSSILRDVGAQVEEYPDGVRIHPLRKSAIKNALIDPRDDHRIAMSFSLLGAAANGIRISSPSCVEKTCPDFFSLLATLGVATSSAS